MAQYVGEYKGIRYGASDIALDNGVGYVVNEIQLDMDALQGEAREAMITVLGGPDGHAFPNLSKAGHAVARAILLSKGLELKDPPARATFKPSNGSVQVPPTERKAATKERKERKRAAVTVKDGETASVTFEANGDVVKVERKPRARKVTKRSIFRKSLSAKGLAEGMTRWHCTACQDSFDISGDGPPEACLQGHTDADYEPGGRYFAGEPAAAE